MPSTPEKGLRRHLALLGVGLCAFLLVFGAGSLAAAPALTGSEAFQERVRETLERHPGLAADTSPDPGPATTPLAELEERHRQLLEERIEGRWFAALVVPEPEPGPDNIPTAAAALTIEQRFADPEALFAFLTSRDALVEAYTLRLGPRGPERGRRLTAHELAAEQRAPRPRPLRLEVRFPGPDRTVVVRRLEFGLRAARQTRERAEGFQRDRRIQRGLLALLSSRDERGVPSPALQAEAYRKALADGLLDGAPVPPEPATTASASTNHPARPEPFIAAEVQVDDAGQRLRVARLLRASDFARRVRDGRESVDLAGADGPRALRTFALEPDGTLTPRERPIAGRDVLELRVVDPAQPDPRRWSRIDFGEPALLREVSLATFGLLNAHLDHARRRLAWKKSSLDVYAEPVFLALNLGGGFAGVGAPLGDAARLAYNVIVSPRYIPRLPTTGQMRQMLLLLTARRLDTRLVHKTPELLSEEDLRSLEAATAGITDAQALACAETISETDLQAMRRLARIQRLDAHYRLTADIATSLALVVGLPDHGFWKELFGNSYVALNGDVSIKNILAALAGAEEATSRHLIPLDDLADGQGPASAWIAYFDVTFDLRALVNSIWDWTHRDLATRKLRRPFPHSPDLGDLAAYEVRAFGYPLLFFHKRSLIRRDLQAYENDYAYAVRGTRIVRHFATREDLEAEVAAGRTIPLGYVRAPDGRGGLAESGLAVFAWRAEGDRGRDAAIILYGLAAFRDQSELVRAEVERFRTFERALTDGAVLERTLPPGNGRAEVPPPRFRTLDPASDAEFTSLLADLRELERLRRLEAWGATPDPADAALAQSLADRLSARGVAVDPVLGDPLVSANAHHSSFVFRRRQDDRILLTQWTRWPSASETEEALRRAREAEQVESLRREALSPGGEGVLYFNDLAEDGASTPEAGPLRSLVAGAGPESGPGSARAALQEAWARLDALPLASRLALAHTRFAGGVADLDTDGDGRPERVAIAAEFPARGRFTRRVRDPLTGDWRVETFEGSRLVRVTTAGTVVDLDRRASDGQELATRTYENLGTLDEPRAGALREETRTIEVLPVPPDSLDPAQPRIRKLRIHRLKGEVREETYGLYDSPLEVLDGDRRGRNRFDEQGRVVFHEVESVARGTLEARVRRLPAGEGPPALLRLARPGTGAFEFVHLPTLQTNVSLVDFAHGGRIHAELASESLGDSGRFEILTVHEYAPEFAGGLVPVTSRRHVARAGQPFPEAAAATLVTLSYDVASRELAAEEQSPDLPAPRRVLWRAPLRAPVETATATRLTRTRYDDDGRGFQARTVARDDGAVLEEATGRFDDASASWTVERRVEGRSVQERRSPAGWLLEERAGPGWRSVPAYDDAGRERERRDLFRPDEGAPEILVRSSDDFRPGSAGRRARVRTWFNGRVHREEQVEFDPEGRLTRAVQSLAGPPGQPAREWERRLEWPARGSSPTRVELLLGGRLRETHEFLGRTADPDGTPIDRYRVRPAAWGLVTTNDHRAGDPAGRWVRRLDAAGRTVTPLEWYPGTDLPRRVREAAPDGTVIAERELSPASADWDGQPCDVETTLHPGPDGTTTPGSRRLFLAGTPVLAGWETPAERIVARPDLPYEAPWYAVARSPEDGVRLILDDTRQASRVVTVYGVTEDPERGRLRIDEVDLRGWFSLPWQRRWIGPDGQPQGIEAGTQPVPDPGRMDARALLAAAATNAPARRTEPDAAAARTLAFAPGHPDPVPFLRESEPRRTATNRWMPDTRVPWIWTARNWLASDGGEIFEEESWRDAAGRLDVTAARKAAPDGSPALRLTWRLGPPAETDLRPLPLTQGSAPLDAAGRTDFSDADFVAFHVRPPGATLRVTVEDGDGRRIVVGPDPDERLLQFWPPIPGVVQWLPSHRAPRRGGEVVAEGGMDSAAGLRVISVAELAARGLNPARLPSWTVAFEGTVDAPRASPLQRLAHDGVGLRLTDPIPHREWGFDDGLARARIEPGDRRQPESVLAAGGRLLARSRWHTAGDRYQQFVMLDLGTPGGPVPLYSIEPISGSLVDHYLLVRDRYTRVLSLTRGFEAPHLESFDPRSLADELTPSGIAFGRTLSPLLPAGSRSDPPILNRMRASVFSSMARGPTPELAAERARLAESLSAESQAGAVRTHPPFVQTWIARRPLPWEPEPGTNAAPPQPVPAPAVQADEVALLFQAAQTRFPASGLLPVAPGTAHEHFVDTAAEAGLVTLATLLDRPNLPPVAREILSFYSDRTDAGLEAARSSYDARTKAPLIQFPGQLRPEGARATGDANLALAEAAFAYGLATRDAAAFGLGRNLVDRLLGDFRAGDDAPRPRPLTLHPFQAPYGPAGLRLWPEAARHPVALNARAFLVLRQIQRGPLREFGDPAWRARVDAAADELGAWLNEVVRPELDRAGITPAEFFEIQDVQGSRSRVAPGRATSSEASLALLDAAPLLGWPDADARRWLENLARAHAVRIGPVSGLDWTFALHRPPAISPEQTARFAATARRLDHAEAAAWAHRALAALRLGSGFIAALTDHPANRALETGVGSFLEPVETRPSPAAAPAAPAAPAPTAQTAPAAAPGSTAWPMVHHPWLALGRPWWERTPAGPVPAPPDARPRPRDLQKYYRTAAWFYLTIIGVTLGWWILRWLRARHHAVDLAPVRRLVPEAVLQAAEMRWALRVLGGRTPEGSPDTRFSNAPVEANFLMQLRAIHKLVVEWRRRVNGWAETDARILEDEEDGWLNGMDEFAVMVGLYFRWVIKAGRKDGLPAEDPLATHEDSNHVWSRLVAYFTEFNTALVTLLEEQGKAGDENARAAVDARIEGLLREMGARRRWEAFDARVAFDFPARPDAFDLLLVQQPGTTLAAVAEVLEKHLRTPAELFRNWVGQYLAFKEREQVYPVHPYLVESARLLPHFALMGLLGLVLHNAQRGGLPIFPFVRETAERLVLEAASLAWALPLALGALATFVATALERYRYEPRLRSTADTLVTDVSVTSMFGRATSVLPPLKPGRRWDPRPWRAAGWALRFLGLSGLGIALARLETPSFPIDLLFKGILAPVILLEALAILLPLALGHTSRWLEDRVARQAAPHPVLRFLNQLNICPTRPASILWMALKYLLQPSVPTGRPGEMARLVGFYFAFSTLFFLIGGYLFQAALGIWFIETWQQGSHWRLLLGTLVFWNTMYLLRFGVYVLCVGTAGLFRVRPLPVTAGALALAWLGAHLLDLEFAPDPAAPPAWGLALALAGAALWGAPPRAARRSAGSPNPTPHPDAEALARLLDRGERGLGVVYMSGDDLGFQKLTPALLMDRWRVLRDRLGAPGLAPLRDLHGTPDDTQLEAGFRELFELEQRCGVTLWHPLQFRVAGQPDPDPSLPAPLRLTVPDAAAVERLLSAWQIRRWLVTMMSTAGHAQDTAVNLVDIALRFAREGLGPHTAFLFISNKYEGSDTNRPSQLRYDQGEHGQRALLARLIRHVAPGSRAYVIHNWTPFGFKAGGMVGMDLVPEETLRLSHMLVLDRNANIHDLDALVLDVRGALLDPETVIVVPGRGTTNTRTPLGQGSQALEEGHRAMLLGLHALGGAAAECLGTGWGNLQAVTYGNVQRALVHPSTRRMPLTSRLRRGSTFVEQAEGLIGFGPHAVGISEDIWGVTQAAHNRIALGGRVRFGLSRAFWHKIRETWSHAEWLAAFPRWSGGFVQLLHDPLMQRLVDGGPLSIFAREMRMNGGRFYLGAPAALANILILPIAVLGDFSPFVEVLAWLWILGLVMSQVLTLNGLVARIDALGFSRPLAAAGGLASALLGLSQPFARPLAPILTVLGAVAAGFLAPFARWLHERTRDLLLFGPQLVIHALGQLIRQSLEFVVSGAAASDAKAVNMPFRALAGPREDRPMETYPNLVNLRSVVWGIGLPLFVLNVFALARLDFLNVLLLLPVLLFSASVLAGPFLLGPRPGPPPGFLGSLLPRLAGWSAAALIFLAAARCLVAGGPWTFAGLVLAGTTLALPLAVAARYAGYRRNLLRRTRRFRELLVRAGLAERSAARLAHDASHNPAADPAKIAAGLAAAGLSPEATAPALDHLKQRLLPWLRRPQEDASGAWWNRTRTAADFCRSFTLAVLMLLWVFVVPVPEQMVVRVGEFQLAFGLAQVLGTTAALALAFAAAVLAGRALEAVSAGLGRRGLRQRLDRAYRAFREQRARSRFAPADEAALFARFTDIVTYLDQGSLEFGHRALDAVEALLASASAPAGSPGAGPGTGNALSVP